MPAGFGSGDGQSPLCGGQITSGRVPRRDTHGRRRPGGHSGESRTLVANADESKSRRGAVAAGRPAWANWPTTVALVLALLLVRVIYLIWLCPWELVEDEAQYWDWSRHFALSYYSKGPGVSWTIGAATQLLGHAEWAIRLPAAVFSAISALVLARLAIDASGGDQRVGLLAAAGFSLAGIYQLEAQLMTIDGPFMACWVLATWLGWRAFAAHRRGATPWGLWALLGAVLGVGFLYKYTIVLLPPAFILFGIMRRRELPWDRRLTWGAVLTAVVFLAVSSPVIIWNAQNGWPTVHHTLGHLGAPGGDKPTQWAHPRPFLPLLKLAVSEVGVLGPPLFVLCVLGTVWAVRANRERRPGATVRSYLLVTGLFVLGFFGLIGVLSRIEANWPISGFTNLLVLAAMSTPEAVADLRRQLADRRHGAVTVAGGPPRPRCAHLTLWKWTVGWGIATQLIVFFPLAAARLPAVGDLVPLYRFTGARTLAQRVQQTSLAVRAATGQEPFVVSRSAGCAGLLAYYLPGQPMVYDAGRYLGGRPSSYDFFPETDLRAPALLGRPAVLVMDVPTHWESAFRWERVEGLGGDPPINIGYGYGGPRADGG